MSHLVVALPVLASLAGAPSQTISQSAVPDDSNARRIEIHLPRAAALTLECWEEGNPRERHLVRRPSAVLHRLVVNGLKADTEYTCRAQAEESPTATSAIGFRTDALPADLKAPVITVPSRDLAQTGYTLYNYGIIETPSRLAWCGSNYLVILDAEGNIRWYYRGPGCGDVDSTFIGDDQILFTGRSTRRYPPTIVGLNKATLWVATSVAGSPYELTNGYMHDAGLSERGDTVFTLAETEQVGGGRGFVIKEVDLLNNMVVWSWDSQLDGEATGALPPHEGGDGYHPNAIYDRWEDGRLTLYLSIWKTSSILKLDYLSKNVVWELGPFGDFTLYEADGRLATQDRWFFNQHDAKRLGDLLFLHDNGSGRSEFGSLPYSRGLQLQLDENRMEARVVREFTETDWHEPVWGGYDWVEPTGHSLITMGHCYEEDDDFYNICSGYDTNQHRAALVELDDAMEVVWRADFTTLQEVTYRSHRIDGCAIFSNVQYCAALLGP